EGDDAGVQHEAIAGPGVAGPAGGNDLLAEPPAVFAGIVDRRLHGVLEAALRDVAAPDVEARSARCGAEHLPVAALRFALAFKPRRHLDHVTEAGVFVTYPVRCGKGGSNE